MDGGSGSEWHELGTSPLARLVAGNYVEREVGGSDRHYGGGGGLNNVVRFEVFTAVTMKNGVFWDVNVVWLL
jgi:hypothetical protein